LLQLGGHLAIARVPVAPEAFWYAAMAAWVVTQPLPPGVAL
jgi:hypothetical protein